MPTVLITGANRGIGLEFARQYAADGFEVIACCRTPANASELNKLATGASVRVLALDVASEGMIADVKGELAGRPIDILINNAGSLMQRMRILEVKEEAWDEIQDLNLKSAVLCSQAVAPWMIERKQGAIINVSSIAGRNGGGPGASAYASAKGGLISFTKALAKELAPHGIRVNAVSPGVIDTPFHEVFSTPEMLRNFVTTIPLGRLGTAMECATVIAFLASDAASYVVGETVEVNGGQLML